MRRGQAANDLFDRLAADARLGLDRAALERAGRRADRVHRGRPRPGRPRGRPRRGHRRPAPRGRHLHPGGDPVTGHACALLQPCPTSRAGLRTSPGTRRLLGQGPRPVPVPRRRAAVRRLRPDLGLRLGAAHDDPRQGRDPDAAEPVVVRAARRPRAATTCCPPTSRPTVAGPGDAVPAAWTMFPVECVARGYLTGSGLVEYRASGAVCGVAAARRARRRLPAARSRSSRRPPRPQLGRPRRERRLRRRRRAVVGRATPQRSCAS